MNHIFPLLIQVCMLSTALAISLKALDTIKETIATLKQLRILERRVEICSQLQATRQNIKDAANFLHQRFPQEKTKLNRTREELFATVIDLENTHHCDLLREAKLKAGKRKLINPKLDIWWPNWVGSYYYTP